MKQIKKFPDYYITEDSEIISKRTKNQKKLTQYVDHFGYLAVGLKTKEGRTSAQRIHRLMMLTYGKESPESMKNPTVDHIDGNKLNNRIDNLQWLSNVDNAYKSAKDHIGKYTIKNKNGEIFIIDNLNDWCRKNDLDRHCLRRSYNKGWWHKNYKIIAKQDQ